MVGRSRESPRGRSAGGPQSSLRLDLGVGSATRGHAELPVSLPHFYVDVLL